jgi:hypothetical protein
VELGEGLVEDWGGHRQGGEEGESVRCKCCLKSGKVACVGAGCGVRVSG